MLRGETKPKSKLSGDYKGSFTFEAELYLDNQKVETTKLPVNYTLRRNELFWKYQLPKGKHSVRVKLLNADSEFVVRMSDVVVYNDRAFKAAY